MSALNGVTSAIVGAANVASGGSSYQVDRSLRLNKADQAYLNRTPSSTGNRKTFTLSFWVKRTIPVANFSPTTASIFGASAGGGSWFDISFYTVDELQVITDAGAGSTGLRTQAIYRDFSSWYHFVIAVDTTNSTANDRIIVYVNGTRQDVTIPSGMPSQDSDTLVNATNAHYFGRDGRSSSIRYGDNYFAEINFVDGQTLAPTEFGAYDSDNNWNPKDTSGLTFGTNGFHLKFADNSSASALGTDSSGNGNNWTVNNISVAAGSDNDSLIDTPTNYQADSGNNGGNYATLNSLDQRTLTGGPTYTLSQGNLTCDMTGGSGASSGDRGFTTSTLQLQTGKKWYWEVEMYYRVIMILL